MKHFVKDSYFEVVSDVNNTWSQIKNIPDYKTMVGVELFTRMFEMAPAVWTQFPWGDNDVSLAHNLADNKAFVLFARNFIGMLDMAIDMLGPDLELVEEQLQELGIRHIRYGVMPKHYPLMGKALLNAMEHFLGDNFDAKRHDSWNHIYTFMSVSMMQGAFQELVKTDEQMQKLQSRNGKTEVKRKAEPKDVHNNATELGKSSQCAQSVSLTEQSLPGIRSNSSKTVSNKSSFSIGRLRQRFMRAKV